MPELTLVDAINLALARALADDPDVVVFGEDVGVNGGVFRATVGLQQRFGIERVFDTPLSEALISGLCVGMAAQGLRPVGEIPTLLFALFSGTLTRICSRDYAAANAQIDECVALAEAKGAVYFKMFAAAQRGCVLALTGKASAAVEMISAGMAGCRATGATVWSTSFLSYLALAYADLGKFDDAWRCVGETMTLVETTKERWFEAEANRIAGEIALRAPEPDAAKAQRYFERALALAREQQAKSWELRAATSMARLWRDQGKPQQASELLAPVYGWFTEGFDTLDLKEAKALLEELAA